MPGPLRATARSSPCRAGWTAPYLSPDEVLEIAAAAPRWAARRRCSRWATGRRTAGRRPAEWLDAHGYDDTLSYVRAMAIRVLEETGLLPHLNPGVLSWPDFQRLKPVAPSMGMMLETTAARLFTEQRRAALRQPGQGPRGPAAGAGGRRAAAACRSPPAS